MRSAARSIVRWIRGRAFVVALAAAGLLAAAAVAWFVVDLTRPPDFAAHGHQPYLAAQQRLHVQEARAQLAVLASALATDRPAQGLAARIERLQSDLEWAVRHGTPLGEAWPDIRSELERLVEQIRSEDPEAEETLTRVRALVAGPGGRP